ncbi:hypothetical protein [Leptolyngbya sp. FACHB-711]|uniref:hypothetical protein n=1 Tax=unclassified Leptolyngbya TaxID=2650499 RepID=UPI001687674C|nr:hypothetical protein [Leptolyngbya sp. FACHB-711]MBD1851321.1 hypothetical protein [Cyanobacteria bacterium FACHB-502]MBD2026588.1 hypothetical protein [Leptolyngbya sp. FACHB-711]
MLNVLVFLAIGVYVGGVIKFWRGFHRTNFSSGRLYLALLWPLLILGNPSYRQNFRRALRG